MTLWTIPFEGAVVQMLPLSKGQDVEKEFVVAASFALNKCLLLLSDSSSTIIKEITTQ